MIDFLIPGVFIAIPIAIPIVIAIVLFACALGDAASRGDDYVPPCPECSGSDNRHEAWCEYGEAVLFTATTAPAIQAGGGFRATGDERRTRARLDESMAALNTRPLGNCGDVLPLHPRTGPALRVVNGHSDWPERT